ncbi:MAG: 16S rRNA (cytosine(1402)-N(4))-methyltransferase RsmH [Candidatus Eisenbacteria bacterium]|nr:16S rRNA (cytosine(1402)-N(4))-methyltransferase RsmH [Candidatus Eisenbacteria bacterium]
MHEPVLVDVVAEMLVTDPSGLYVDGTVGGAAHARKILERLSPEGCLWGFDWDEGMLEIARRRLSSDSERVTLFHDPFSQIGARLAGAGRRAHGVLLDLGLNTEVLDDPARGFQYRDPSSPLDMRMDRRRERTAASILNGSSEEDLLRLFRERGELRRPRAAARAIVRERERAPLATSGDLIRGLRRGGALSGGPAELSRLYQALRFEVNGELEELDAALRQAPEWLVVSGRLAVLSYESLSDRRVKQVDRPGPGHVPHMRSLTLSLIHI